MSKTLHDEHIGFGPRDSDGPPDDSRLPTPLPDSRKQPRNRPANILGQSRHSQVYQDRGEAYGSGRYDQLRD